MRNCRQINTHDSILMGMSACVPKAHACLPHRYLNGEPQDEPFTNEAVSGVCFARPLSFCEAARYDLGPVTVPEGCVLVLGDNRSSFKAHRGLMS